MSGINFVYGIVENPPAALAHARTRPEDIGKIGPMSGCIGRGSPAFRLNSPGWARLSPDVVQSLSGTDALVAQVRTTLVNRCWIFSPLVRRFIVAYLDFVAREVQRRSEELEAMLVSAGLGGENGFPSYRDWIFSALLPVPHAYLDVAGDNGRRDVVGVDILFWTGRSVVAVYLEGRSMPTLRMRRDRELLLSSEPTVRVASIKVPHDDSEWNFDEALLGLLDHALLPAGELPFGPYRILQ